MAGPVYVKKRLYNPELIIDTNSVLGNSLRQQIDGTRRTFYSIKWTGTPQAGEELGTAANSVKDGSTTPFAIVVVSASDSDKRATAAGMVHSVALIGVSVSKAEAVASDLTNPKATVEVITMNGTTDVNSTRMWIWVDHAYACEWGTGATHDAEGDITIESPADTDLLTIKATYNESNGGVWHFPAGRRLTTTRVKMSMNAVAAAQDGNVLSGTFTCFEHTLNDGSNNDIDYYVQESPGSASITFPRETQFRNTTKTSKVLWSNALTANAIASDIEIEQLLHGSTKPHE